MGGLARRATFLRRFVQEHPGASIFQVDAGALFNHRAPDPLRSQILLEGVAKLGVEIMNLTPADARELERLGAAGKVKQPQMVSANVLGAGRKTIAPPYAVRRARDGSRIVFIGLSSVSEHEAMGYMVESPQETLKRLLPQIRQGAELVVLLAYMPNREVVDIAVNQPGVDVIISAFEEQFAVAPYQIGHAWILQAQYEGRMVGHAALELSPEKKLEKLAPHHIVGLDATFADEPEMAALVARAKPAAAAAGGQKGQ